MTLLFLVYASLNIFIPCSKQLSYFYRRFPWQRYGFVFLTLPQLLALKISCCKRCTTRSWLFCLTDGSKTIAVSWGIGLKSSGLINFPALALWKKLFGIRGLGIPLAPPVTRLSDICPFHGTIIHDLRICVCYTGTVQSLYMSLLRLPLLLLFHKQPRTTRPGLLASHTSVSCA
jgi:hypothetical protein